MTLKELVELACEKSIHFAAKVQWYRERKNPRKIIDLEWLMPQLEEILGKEFVENAAQEEIEKQEQEIEKVVDELVQEAPDGTTNEVQT